MHLIVAVDLDLQDSIIRKNAIYFFAHDIWIILYMLQAIMLPAILLSIITDTFDANNKIVKIIYVISQSE